MRSPSCHCMNRQFERGHVALPPFSALVFLQLLYLIKVNVEVQLLCSQVTVSVEHLLRCVEAPNDAFAHP